MGDPHVAPKAFAVLEAAAVAGARCPFNTAYGGPKSIRPDTLNELVRRGDIEIEVSGHNWRRVRIMVGPNAGRMTAPEPSGCPPYLVINRAGVFKHGVRVRDVGNLR